MEDFIMRLPGPDSKAKNPEAWAKLLELPVAPSTPVCTVTVDDCYVKIDWDAPTKRGQAITRYEVGRYWGKSTSGAITWESIIEECGDNPSVTRC
jgi:hypothetical protein